MIRATRGSLLLTVVNVLVCGGLDRIFGLRNGLAISIEKGLDQLSARLPSTLTPWKTYLPLLALHGGLDSIATLDHVGLEADGPRSTV